MTEVKGQSIQLEMLDVTKERGRHQKKEEGSECINISAVMPSQLESSMESLIKVFHRYADKDDGKVNFEEFVSLVVGLSIACEQIYQLQTMKSTAKK
ncbi:unnamed protein product [Coregonus sp. 'balchen']|nr:unnamed protein product [Coregonus sp. 'balchen']